MKEIKSIFKNHNASVTEVHVTSDGQIFFLKHHATSHADGLEDKKVKTITREEADAIPDSEEVKAEEAEMAKKFDEAAEKSAEKAKQEAEEAAAIQEEIEASEKAAAAKKKK